jgi:hypothetical protein
MDVGGVECTEQEVSDLDHCDDERHVGHGLLMEYLVDYRSATGPLSQLGSPRVVCRPRRQEISGDTPSD